MLIIAGWNQITGVNIEFEKLILLNLEIALRILGESGVKNLGTSWYSLIE